MRGLGKEKIKNEKQKTFFENHARHHSDVLERN